MIVCLLGTAISTWQLSCLIDPISISVLLDVIDLVELGDSGTEPCVLRFVLSEELRLMTLLLRSLWVSSEQKSFSEVVFSSVLYPTIVYSSFLRLGEACCVA